jgi:hypothetical protein
VVVAVVAGGVTVAALRGPSGASRLVTPAGMPSPPPTGGGGRLAPPDTLVRNGDLVRATGQVLALPGRPVRLCAPLAEAATVEMRVKDEVPRYCTDGVTLLGADLERLSGRHKRHGVVWGDATVTGRYADRAVTVTEQALVRPNPPDDPSVAVSLDPYLAGLTLPADCAPPAGGWPRYSVQNDHGFTRVRNWALAHPSVVGSVVVSYPDVYHLAETDQVLLVGTIGDLEQARREIRERYHGPLCVTNVEHSRAELLAAEAVIQHSVMADHSGARLGITAFSGEMVVHGEPQTPIEAVVYDEPVHALRVQAGEDLVAVMQVFLRRVT